MPLAVRFYDECRLHGRRGTMHNARAMTGHEPSRVTVRLGAPREARFARPSSQRVLLALEKGLGGKPVPHIIALRAALRFPEAVGDFTNALRVDLLVLNEPSALELSKVIRMVFDRKKSALSRGRRCSQRPRGLFRPSPAKVYFNVEGHSMCSLKRLAFRRELNVPLEAGFRLGAAAFAESYQADLAPFRHCKTSFWPPCNFNSNQHSEGTWPAKLRCSLVGSGHENEA
jgi:hypothetical protein